MPNHCNYFPLLFVEGGPNPGVYFDTGGITMQGFFQSNDPNFRDWTANQHSLDIIEEPLILSPPTHTWATKLCPHCGEFRNMTGFVEGLWEANESDEIRYYLFHEPYQFLSSYWHNKDMIFLKELSENRRKEYLNLFTPGEVDQIWGDSNGNWSQEYIELFEGEK